MGARRVPSRFAPAATRDLAQIHAYVGGRSPAAAARVAARILEGVETLERDPEIGQAAEDVRPVGRYRHWVVRPYRLIYRFDGNEIVVLRCWDARRNPADLRVVDSKEPRE